MNIWKDIYNDTKDIMLVLFTNNIHYSLLSEKKQINKQDIMKYENMKLPIIDIKNNKNDPKTLKDKRRQNFHITCNNYKLIKNKLYYNMSKNKKDLYKISMESEKLNLFSNTYLDKGHIGYVRLYNEILEKKFI